LFIEEHFIGLPLQRSLHGCGEIVRHLGRANDDARFRIDVGRARVEIKRTDENLFLVDNECLGMQGRLGTTGSDKLRACDFSIRADFIDPDAVLQQRFAAWGIAGVHRELIIRCQ
jgi:hypothetical protein